MKKASFTIMLVLLTLPTLANLNSKQFVDCFVKASNVVIEDIQLNGTKGEKTRICSEISQNNIDRYFSKFSEIKNGEISYFSSKAMGNTKLIDLYNYIKDDMHCFENKSPGQSGSLFGAIINAPTYKRNLKLTNSALELMVGTQLWDSAFSPSIYNELKEFDTSFCNE